MTKFDPTKIEKLFKPEGESKNGQVTIIGGSNLFHGAPLLSLVTASRIVDMVYFSSPEPSIGEVANKLKSDLFSFIWVPWEEVDRYIEKSDSVLIGPGLMRYRSEKNLKEQTIGDDAWKLTSEVTENLLKRFPDKKWVIDAGSLQVMKTDWIPKDSILTPNKREYDILFGDMDPAKASTAFGCTIVLKGIVDRVYMEEQTVEVSGGNVGMAKGGTGDVLAGLTVALYAKNDALPSATCASYVIKKAGDDLFGEVGPNFNADDLAGRVPKVLSTLQN